MFSIIIQYIIILSRLREIFPEDFAPAVQTHYILAEFYLFIFLLF